MRADPEMIAALRKDVAAHKYDHGHALVLAGGVGRGGAARLAARAALRVGAGLVTIGCPPAALQENAARLDAIMLRRINDAAGLTECLCDPRITALCLGPGLGFGAREEGLLEAALRAQGASLVLDADALTLLAQRPNAAPPLPPDSVITPHAGEFARLFPDLAKAMRAAEDASASSAILCEAAERLGCVVLLKGAVTRIAAPDGRVAVNDATGAEAAPWLATAGSGDVLAGLITGLVARGVPVFDAARWAAALHLACAQRFGPGLIAEDLPEILPAVLRDLGV